MRKKHRLDIFRRCVDFPSCEEIKCSYLGSCNQGIPFCIKLKRYLDVFPEEKALFREIAGNNFRRKDIMAAGRPFMEYFFERKLKECIYGKNNK
jgi:hypothetical protein